MNSSPSDKAADEMFEERPASYETLQRAYEQMRDACSEAHDSWMAERKKLWATELVLRDLASLISNSGFHNSIEMAAARKILHASGLRP